MSYLFIEAPENHPTFGLYSEDLLPLVDKYKNVNLFSLNSYYHESGYEDDDGSISLTYHHFVFGAKDKRSAMKVFIEHSFPLLNAKNIKLEKKIPFIQYLENNFGKDLVNELKYFEKICKLRGTIGLASLNTFSINNDLHLQYIIDRYFSEIFPKSAQYIKNKYNFGADLVAAISKEKLMQSRNIITINLAKEFLSQLLENWRKRKIVILQLWERLAREYGENFVTDIEEFLGISRESITIPQVKTYLYRNSDSLIYDETEFLFELGHGEEEKNLAKVIAYMKEKYPEEYDEHYPTLFKKSKDLSMYKPLSEFFKKP